MQDNWEERLSCTTRCSKCKKELDKRILSVYDHQPICMEYKKEEEARPDYEEVSKKMIGQCMAETEIPRATAFTIFTLLPARSD